ncbi:MAG: carboxypeptidase-like regulatory domain-containing protein, partial [Bacteroidota bacterium]
MKLTTFILLATTMLVSASVYSQGTKISLNYSEITYEEMFREIESQTEFRFAFSSSKLDPNQKVSIDVKKKTLEEILDNSLPEDISYEILDRYVVIVNAGEKRTATDVQLQQKSISGKVTDEYGEPLPGVTVLIKGTTQGTVTNMDGNYTLSDIPDGAILHFSFVGMLTQEIEVGSQTSINVTMKADAIGLDEVVAIGYGTLSGKEVTSAIVSVKSEDFLEGAITDPAELIRGK